jgi:5-(carboxyamino)imidazole ribonucleotide mutase
VGTTAIGKAGAKNAALLAVAVLALSDVRLRDELKAYRRRMQQEVEADDAEVLQANQLREDYFITRAVMKTG